MKITDFHSLLDNNSSAESYVPAPLNGNELQELINPISGEEFVNTYFARASLSLEGHPHK
ncbi:MAG: cupin, partial [Sphingobacteriales bacterium]